MQGINDNHVSVAFKKSCHALVVVHKMRPIAIVAYVCGMTKYRKGPQRTHKRPTKNSKGALRAKLQEIGTN